MHILTSVPVIVTGITGGEASTEKYGDVHSLTVLALIILGFFMIAFLEDVKCGKTMLLYIAAVVALMVWKPHLFFYETTVTNHAPYTITGTVLKIDKNDSEEYKPTVTLDSGEKVKVKENVKNLYQFIGSKVTLRCDYDEMPEKKITSSTSCDFQGAGSVPTPSVSN